ncbi:MAG: hypothetical protein GQ561_04675 [Calditrichae bacterium]|nr:hypothetical protein [Calditrichia bacterium]
MTYAQDTGRVEVPPHIYQSFLTKTGSECWGYGGVDVVGSDSTIFPFSNPALISANCFSAAIEFAKHYNARGPFGFKYDNQTIVPSYAVVQFPVKDWKMAAGYANYYDLQIIFDPEPIQTIQQPAGTGEFWDAKIHIQLHTFFAAVQYSIHPKFSIGFTLAANYFRRRDEIFHFEARGDDWSWQSVLGIAYRPDENLAFAASFRYLNDIQYTVDVSDEGLFIASPDTEIVGVNEIPVASLQREFTGYARFPWEFKVGLSYRFQTRFQIFAMVNFQEWSRVHPYYDDQQQFHIGLQARVFSGNRLSLGFFTQWEADKGQYSLAKYLDQNFITIGLSQKLFKKFQFNISFMDSRLFSNPEVERNYGEEADEFHQTKILLGLQYKFI